MSYQIDNEKNKKPEIEMPPLPEEPVVEAAQNEQQAVSEPEATVEEPKPEPVKETSNEKNIRALREKAERAERYERERDEAIKRLQQYESQKPQEAEEPEYNFEDNDLLEGKHLKQYKKKLKKIEEDLQQQQQQNQLAATEHRLKQELPDFDKVVSNHNIEQLRDRYPELADTLNNSHSDIYTKAKSAYRLIKELNIAPNDDYEKDRQRALNNSAKPRPLASVAPQQGDSPLTRANAFAEGLTDDLAKQLRKEMYDAMKNR